MALQGTAVNWNKPEIAELFNLPPGTYFILRFHHSSVQFCKFWVPHYKFHLFQNKNRCWQPHHLRSWSETDQRRHFHRMARRPHIGQRCSHAVTPRWVCHVWRLQGSASCDSKDWIPCTDIVRFVATCSINQSCKRVSFQNWTSWVCLWSCAPSMGGSTYLISIQLRFEFWKHYVSNSGASICSITISLHLHPQIPHLIDNRITKNDRRPSISNSNETHSEHYD